MADPTRSMPLAPNTSPTIKKFRRLVVDTRRTFATVGTLVVVSDDASDRHDEGDDVEPLIPIDSDAAMMATARRRYGAVGAIVAGGMLGLDRLLGRKPKEEAPVVWEAAGEPENIDRGMTFDVDDDTTVASNPARSRRRNVRRRRGSGTGPA